MHEASGKCVLSVNSLQGAQSPIRHAARNGSMAVAHTPHNRSDIVVRPIAGIPKGTAAKLRCILSGATDPQRCLLPAAERVNVDGPPCKC